MRVSITVLLAAAILAASPVVAQPRLGQCMIGPSFGSTLLYPYFEVDLNDTSGVTTLLSVVNGFVDPVLTRMVVWTDWGNPVLAFDIYLTGFDVQSINVRGLLDGQIPSTGAGANLSGFDFCNALPPFHSNPALTVAQRGQLAADLTGVPGPIFADCAGQAHGDGIARGYVTVDAVDECSGVEAANAGFGILFTPANVDYPYFADGGGASGIAVIANQLWGDFHYVDFAGAAAQGSEAVALWADSTLFAGTGIFTFYGRYSGWDGRDDRVPLPYLWDQRFFNGGPFAGGANLLVYRDTGSPPATATCGGHPPWYPLPDHTTSLDEDAGGIQTIFGNNFPVAAQKVDVGTLGIPYNFGWIQVDTEVMGSWVQPTLTAGGLFSAGYNGAAVESLCVQSPPVPLAPPAPSSRAGNLDKRAAAGSPGFLRRLRPAEP